MNGFFEMGGYGAYVWPAYAVSAAALIGLVLLIWRRGRKLRKELDDADRARKTDEGA